MIKIYNNLIYRLSLIYNGTFNYDSSETYVKSLSLTSNVTDKIKGNPIYNSPSVLAITLPIISNYCILLALTLLDLCLLGKVNAKSYCFPHS